jgi:hypothetical protein
MTQEIRLYIEGINAEEAGRALLRSSVLWDIVDYWGVTLYTEYGPISKEGTAYITSLNNAIHEMFEEAI